MSRWMYQMSESSWPMENYRSEVREGVELRWPTRNLMFTHVVPAAGDLMICYYAPSACPRPGFCGLGLITKYLPKKRRFDWLPLPPTNALKRRPWWDERAKEIGELVRAQSPRGTMYQLPAVLDTDLRQGMFAWADSSLSKARSRGIHLAAVARRDRSV